MSAQPKASSTSNPSAPPQRPQPTAIQQDTDGTASELGLRPKKKRNHRGGKKKRTRKQSFAPSTEDGSVTMDTPHRLGLSQTAIRNNFFRQGQNLSSTSIDSEALLDHREQQSMRPRRSSVMGQSAYGQSFYDTSTSFRPSFASPLKSNDNLKRMASDNMIEDDEVNEQAPLLNPYRSKTTEARIPPGSYIGSSKLGKGGSSAQRPSSKSSTSSRRRTIFDRQSSAFPQVGEQYNVNYPPSMPGSPTLAASQRDMSFGDMILRDDLESRVAPNQTDMDFNESAVDDESSSHSRTEIGFDGRRHTIALQAEEDVCFPVEGMSELADDDLPQALGGAFRREGAPRRRRAKWPDLAMLDDWSRFEKEGRSEERRAKKITEPQLIGGRLRPIHKGWHRAEDDAPYRFTYFNEEFQSTIHSQTISELVQPGGSFRELFKPEPPVLSDSSDTDSDSEDEGVTGGREEISIRHVLSHNGESKASTRRASSIPDFVPEPRHDTSATREKQSESLHTSGDATPNGIKSPPPISNKSINEQPEMPEKPTRYGDRPTWWLDVLSPTDAEMKVLSKTFGIHPLTAEDIMMQEAREKVELFRNYYFVNYRSFEQDMSNEDFLEPVNMYVVVFREGVISFHFSLTPHPANVRRRIRQLKDYLILSADWISYAIIDDITDVFAPLIQSIEDEVDDIDDAILKLHSSDSEHTHDADKKSEAGDYSSGGDMLRRVGDCRKKVMGLYRLLGNKADVIKGFAKRCNEHWEVAPRSEIGLYLGDIQDHIVTMTGNLSHYEKILARSHGNYLAQINIRMNERQEQTADVLGKLTVLGTIVLPMNIITGLWGMNVWVPGQDAEGDLRWFWCLTAGLLVFGLSCFFAARWLYRIV